MDIFSFGGNPNTQAIKVFKGYYNSDVLQFEEIIFYNDFGGNLTVTDLDGNVDALTIESVVYPAIEDIDGDGDLDVITIKSNGGYLRYYQNMSVENGWGLDSLFFIKPTECFGGALELGNSIYLELSDTPGECVPLLLNSNSNPNTTLHSGYSFLAFDNDGDGDKELLFGDGAFFKMNLLLVLIDLQFFHQ